MRTAEAIADLRALLELGQFFTPQTRRLAIRVTADIADTNLSANLHKQLSEAFEAAYIERQLHGAPHHYQRAALDALDEITYLTAFRPR